MNVRIDKTGWPVLPDFLKRQPGDRDTPKIPLRPDNKPTLKLDGTKAPSTRRREKDEAEQVARALLKQHGETTVGRIRKAAPDLSDSVIQSAKRRLVKCGYIEIVGRTWKTKR